MRYVSTRGEAPALDFVEVMLAGLARDGGLYVPETWPRLDAGAIAGFAGRPYAEVAVEVIRPFVGDSIAEPISPAWRARPTAPSAIRPSRRWCSSAPSLFVLELFHGPTLAFKDLAMQLLAPADGPRAASARRAHHHRGRDLGRHRRRRGRSLPRPRPGRRRRAVSARPHLRRAAAHDDDGAGRTTSMRSRSKAPSTTARRW